MTSQSQPFFSIVIPTRDRPHELRRCLEACARLDFPRERFEVCVVDDGGETPLQEVVAPFRAQVEVTLLTRPHAGPAAARNAGAASARGRFLVFTDDDCQPTPTWLRALEARCIESPECIVGGHTINAAPHNAYSAASQTLIDYLYSYYNAEPDSATFFTANNMAVPAASFAAMGGFDTSFPKPAAEDREFCDRWLRGRRRMVYAPEVVAHHEHVLTLRSFWRQHFTYGRGAFRFHRVRSRSAGTGVRLEPASFYVNLLRYPFSLPSTLRGLRLAFLLVVSQAANVAGYLYEAATRPRTPAAQVR